MIVVFDPEEILEVLQQRCPVDRDDSGYEMWLNIVCDVANLFVDNDDRSTFISDCDMHGVIDDD